MDFDSMNIKTISNIFTGKKKIVGFPPDYKGLLLLINISQDCQRRVRKCGTKDAQFNPHKTQ